jgi:hypothetical protein
VFGGVFESERIFGVLLWNFMMDAKHWAGAWSLFCIEQVVRTGSVGNGGIQVVGQMFIKYIPFRSCSLNLYLIVGSSLGEAENDWKIEKSTRLMRCLGLLPIELTFVVSIKRV